MKNIGEVIETYALLTVAAFLMSLGVVWIFNSEQIVPGGVTGIGIIIENLTKGMGNGETGIPVWLSNLVINISFLLLIGILMVISAISFGRLNKATDALLDAADFVAAFQKRQGLYISCIEEIAFKRGFIDKEQLLALAEPLLKTNYGKYLVEVANGL